MNVAIIDYGMGNLGSVRRAFEDCGAKPRLVVDPGELSWATHVVLPGVGAFPDGMRNLRERGWVEALRRVHEEAQLPLLGICLGMQLLATTGYEVAVTAGLALVPGEVKRLEPRMETERIPHVGWNEVHPVRDCLLFRGIAPGTDFYFVHSYAFVPAADGALVAQTPYCGSFPSVVQDKKVYGVQFHPEKSSRAGMHLLRNFLDAT